MTQTNNSKTTTIFVIALVAALLYYIQKDVRQQTTAIIQEYNKTTKPTPRNALPLCPKSKYEGGTFFSQYYEDYILAHIFRDVPKGVFIDIGAAHPTHNNMTYHFYKKGWRGISIDPIPAFVKKYNEKRPGDLFVNIGISDEESTLTFYHCGDDCELGTFDQEGAKRHTEKGGVVFSEKLIPVKTIAQVLTEHPKKHIHFANVDVEGWEQNVLQSFDFKKNRPEIFVIESTKPVSEETNYEIWESHLTQNGYLFAMTDYLNRYYLDLSSKNLKKYLQRFSYIDMCVRQSKIGTNIRPTSWGTDLIPRPQP